MTESQIPKNLNDFFSNTIKTLGIPKFDQIDPDKLTQIDL